MGGTDVLTLWIPQYLPQCTLREGSTQDSIPAGRQKRVPRLLAPSPALQGECDWVLSYLRLLMRIT